MDIFTELPGPVVYFSQALGAKVYDHQDHYIGKFSDFLVDLQDYFPQVHGILITKGKQTHFLAWPEVQIFGKHNIKLSSNARLIDWPPTQWATVVGANGPISLEQLAPLGKLILDRQIVDTQGKKVIRVTDIHLIRVGQRMRVTHASVGAKAILRRLGFWPMAKKWITTFSPQSPLIHSETLISWRYVHALPHTSFGQNLKLNTANSAEIFENFHPADLADILEDLDGKSRVEFFGQLDPEVAAEALSEVDEDLQAQMIQDQDPERAAEILEHMEPDDAADIISDLPGKEALKIFANIDDNEVQEEIQELLAYEPDTAGGLMSTAFFQAAPDHQLPEILELIKQTADEYESVYDLYVLDEQMRFVGICTLRELICAPAETRIREIMKRDDLKMATPEQSWQEVMSIMYKYNLSMLPIVDAETTEFLGVVSLDDLLPYMWKE